MRAAAVAMFRPGDHVSWGQGAGVVVKLYRSGAHGAARIKPDHGGRQVTRMLQRVRKT
jgi:hypothetical protein